MSRKNKYAVITLALTCSLDAFGNVISFPLRGKCRKSFYKLLALFVKTEMLPELNSVAFAGTPC